MSEVRVRFAPSPTGFLHVGGARTAIYNYLYAKATNGKLIIRVEDTDQNRSTKEFEDSQLNDLKWLGIEFDEGPYRQSERIDIYREYAEKLIDQGKAYYCFCSDEELDRKRAELTAKKEAPHYDGTCRKISKQDALKRIEEGESAVIRFKVPHKEYSFVDSVRGDVSFPENMVGDFIIIRSNGLPVYNFCCTVDDMLMKITHVIRAEDHLPNTLRQLMIYEALEGNHPQFAHVSLLIGADRQKLSKRHGATSVNSYREATYLPEAFNNYLCQLGWSHPEEVDIFTLQDIISKFDLNRFNKSPAIFDIEKFNWINGQHLRLLSYETLSEKAAVAISLDSPYHQQSKEWQRLFLELYKEQVEFYADLEKHIENLFSVKVISGEQEKEAWSWESTPVLASFLDNAISLLMKDGKTHATNEDFANWSSSLKKELSIKGKFLFKGMRVVLTGRAEGPDLKTQVQLTPLEILKVRITNGKG